MSKVALYGIKTLYTTYGDIYKVHKEILAIFYKLTKS